jgi:hypothetical protein
MRSRTLFALFEGMRLVGRPPTISTATAARRRVLPRPPRSSRTGIDAAHHATDAACLWLLLHRSVREGDMTAKAREEKKKIRLESSRPA